MGLFTEQNHFALILGGSSGLGLATAHKLATEGMHLILVHRDRRSVLAQFEKELESMRSKGVEVIAFNQNALQVDKQQEMVEQIKGHLREKQGKIRVLLHAISRGNLKRLVTAPGSLDQPYSEGLSPDFQAALRLMLQPPPMGDEALLGPEDFSQTIQAMAISLWTWTQLLISNELFLGDARILGLTSEGNQKAWPYYAAVSAAKATLESLIRAMARELAPHGIRSNVIQAGITDTPSLRMIPGSEQLKASAIYRNPFGRLTTAEDVANVVALLCTDEASWINGALIPVDGGERLG